MKRMTHDFVFCLTVHHQLFGVQFLCYHVVFMFGFGTLFHLRNVLHKGLQLFQMHKVSFICDRGAYTQKKEFL